MRRIKLEKLWWPNAYQAYAGDKLFAMVKYHPKEHEWEVGTTSFVTTATRYASREAAVLAIEAMFNLEN